MMEHGMQTNVKQNSNTISCYNVFDLTLHIIFFPPAYLKIWPAFGHGCYM